MFFGNYFFAESVTCVYSVITAFLRSYIAYGMGLAVSHALAAQCTLSAVLAVINGSHVAADLTGSAVVYTYGTAFCSGDCSGAFADITGLCFG